MDKTRLEILRSICKGGIISSMLTHEQALEAMKIAMKQAWDAAIQEHSVQRLSNMVMGNYKMKSFDEWFNGLEEKK